MPISQTVDHSSKASTYSFNAFISYSRQDLRFARKLEKELERYRAPKNIGLRYTRLNIFRDVSDLVDNEVSEGLRKAIADSEHLILICSPHSCQSKYVGLEIEEFAAQHGKDKIILLLRSGIPNNELKPHDHSEARAFHPALTRYLAEPLAADYRELPGVGFWWKREQFREAKLAVLASLFHTDKETLARREKQRRARRRLVATAATLTLAVVFSTILYTALRNARNTRNEKARSYWKDSGAALKNGQPGKALHLLAEAVATAQDKQLVSNLMIASGSLMPEVRLRQTFSHGDRVTGASFNSDGTKILTSSADGTAQLWDAINGTPIGPRLKCGAEVLGAIFHQDATRILTWSLDGTTRLWEATTGKQISQIDHKAAVVQAVFSRDGTRILSRDADGNVQLLDTPTGTIKNFNFGPITGVTFNRDESELLSWGYGGARVWRASDGSPVSPELKVTADGDPLVEEARFSRDEKTVIGWKQDGDIDIWNAANGNVIKEVSGGMSNLGLRPDAATVLIQQPDGLHLTDTSTGATVKHWPAENAQASFGDAMYNQDGSRFVVWEERQAMVFSNDGGPLSRPLSHHDRIAGATFNHLGNALLTWSVDGTAHLWTSAAWESIQPLQHTKDVEGGVFSGNDSQMLTWSNDGTVKLWEIAPKRPQNLALVHSAKVLNAKFNRAGTEILVSTDDGVLSLWDSKAGKPILSAKGLPNTTGAMFSPDERKILGFGRDGIWLSDRENNATLWSTNTNQGVEGVSFDNEGTRILAWDTDGALLLIDSSNGSQILKLPKNGGSIRSATLSQDGTRILAWGSYYDTKLWSVKNEKVLWSAPFTRATFNKEETRVLISGEGGVQVVDSASGKPLIPSLKHEHSTWGARFASDEKRILSWGDDGVRLWDAVSGQQLGGVLRQDQPVIRASFNRNETRILTWSEDGKTRLWDISNSTGPLLTIDSEATPHLRTSSYAHTGAKFTGDEKRILTWNENGVLLSDGTNGDPVGARLAAPSEITGVDFSKDDSRVLVWDDQTKTVRVWSLGADLDFPQDQFKLQIAALTGVEFDPAANAPRVMEPERWQKYLTAYRLIAEEHSRTCQFAPQNVVRWFP